MRAVGFDVATLPDRLKGSGTPGNLADHHNTDVIVRSVVDTLRSWRPLVGGEAKSGRVPRFPLEALLNQVLTPKRTPKKLPGPALWTWQYSTVPTRTLGWE